MSNYLIKKIIHFIIVLSGVLTLVFLMRVSGSPINYYIDYTLSDEEIVNQQRD